MLASPSRQPRELLSRGARALGRGRSLKLLVAASLLLGTLVYVQVTIGWLAIASAFGSLDPMRLGEAFALTLLSFGFRAQRLLNYFRPNGRVGSEVSRLGAAGSLVSALSIVTRHNLINLMLPMRLGEASFPVLLNMRWGIPSRESLSALLLLRVLDFLALLLGALVVWLAMENGFSALLSLLVISLAVPVASQFAEPVLVVFFDRVIGLMKRAFGAGASKTPKGTVGVVEFESRSRMKLSGHTAVWLLTLAAWTTKLAAFTLIVSAFTVAPMSMGSSDTHGILGIIGAELSSVLPVHGFGGAGTYELGFYLGAALGESLEAFAGSLSGSIPPGAHLQRVVSVAVQLHIYVLLAAIAIELIAVSFSLMTNSQKTETQL